MKYGKSLTAAALIGIATAATTLSSCPQFVDEIFVTKEDFRDLLINNRRCAKQYMNEKFTLLMTYD